METKRTVSTMWAMACCVLMGSVSVWGDFYGRELIIGYPAYGTDGVGFYATNDAAGYSDWIWYGPTDAHDHPYHEILSGEWGAAIYYDGIGTALTADPNDSSTRRQAMWLTQRFSYPDFYTNSDFVYGDTCIGYPDTANPVPNNDKGISVIRNQQVEITIDYEVVDLDLIDSTTDRSPMGYVDEVTGYSKAMPSDRFCFLQTYTIRNIDPNETTLTGLEFYQMLHSHGNDEYAKAVNSTYTNASWSDPLEDYTPYNSVHQMGNFHYDITQWNSMRSPGTSDHVDYVSFSSTIEPDWIDTDTFRGGHSDALRDEYTEGGYMHVKDRALNGVDTVYMDEVAGSMGWSLGTLDPNETTSFTIAFMFGEEAIPDSAIQLTKTIIDPNACYSPGDELTYRISWENVGSTDAENAILIDYLPAGVVYPVTYTFDPNFNVVSSDPNYDETANTYELYLGTIPGNSGGFLDLPVLVTEMAPPAGILRNTAEIYTSIGDDKRVCDANVCCWTEGGIIYVDAFAEGNNNGSSWEHAFVDLQDALTQYRAGCGTELWVAAGIYDPGRQAKDTFDLPDGLSVYGGHKGGSVNGNDRNPKKYVTVLAGDTDAVRNDTIVTMGAETLLDGFTVTGASSDGYGICGFGVDFTIENCTVENNDQYGIYAENGDVTVNWCKILLNTRDGIYHDGAGYMLMVDNCWMMRNGEYGVQCARSTPIVKNSIVSESCFVQFARAGIRLYRPTSQPVLYNLTISNNRAEGIYFEDDHDVYNDPNNLDWPDIQNCIVYYNNNNGPQFSEALNMNIDNVAKYCCIQDCNEVNYNHSDVPGFAYTIDPNGTPDPNNYHLAYNSFCKDKGNPDHNNADVGMDDMDRLERIINERVDIGADEIDCEDVSHSLDWNSDGLVNLYEFSVFQKAWLSHDPNDPALSDPNYPMHNDYNDPNSPYYVSDSMKDNWNTICDLESAGASQYVIDLEDLAIFWWDDDNTKYNWLWTACWLTEEYLEMMSGGESMMMAPGGGEEMLMAESVISVQTEIQLEESPVVEEISIEEQILSLKDSIEFLEKLWLQEPDIQQDIAAEDWKMFMDAVYQGLLELQYLETEGI